MNWSTRTWSAIFARVAPHACACNAPSLTLALHQNSIFEVVGRQVLWTNKALASQERLQ